jgi:EAL domain-containing protein (putative c-di-GMP-specific phosphodiesterase class I)
MKLTKEQYEYLKSKKSYQTEGFVKKMFAKFLVDKLKNNSNFMKAIDDADSAAENLRKSIEKAEKAGVKVPAGLKKYAGL